MGNRLYCCWVCDKPHPQWTITRRGDVATTWACPDHLSDVCDEFQRDAEITELVVTHHLKALEWAEMFGNRQAL